MKKAVKRRAKKEAINHPAHYGGEDNPYEAIKIIEALGFGFCLGNTFKYMARAGKKNKMRLEDLQKSLWYLNREVQNEIKAQAKRKVRRAVKKARKAKKGKRRG